MQEIQLVYINAALSYSMNEAEDTNGFNLAVLTMFSPSLLL